VNALIFSQSGRGVSPSVVIKKDRKCPPPVSGNVRHEEEKPGAAAGRVGSHALAGLGDRIRWDPISGMRPKKRKGKLAAVELNVLLLSISNGWMSYPKLLKPPARRLLLTFVMTAGMAVSISGASPRVPPRPAHGHAASVVTRSRARQVVDYSQIEGVQRWGLNE
jgi:hypothetical protein